MTSYNKITRRFLLTTAAFCGLALVGGAGIAKAESFDDAKKAEIGAIIEDYIMENPELIMKAVEKHRQNQAEEAQRLAQENIKKYISYFAGDEMPVAGNLEGEITVVEFFDYNCGYCKRAFDDVQSVLEENDNIRFVFQEMPILGPSSMDAAKWALAAKEQGQYFEYHQALMETKLPKTVENLAKIAEELGLDVDKMKETAGSEEIQAQINKSVAAARSIGISGTPAFVIGEELFPGYLGPDGISAAIEEATASK